MWYLHGKGKALPLLAWTDLWVPGVWNCQISWQSAHEGGNVISPSHGRLFPPPPRKYKRYSFLLQPESVSTWDIILPFKSVNIYCTLERMLVKTRQKNFFFSRLKMLFFGTPREGFAFLVNCIAVRCNILTRDSPKLSVWRWKKKRKLPPDIREPVTCSWTESLLPFRGQPTNDSGAVSDYKIATVACIEFFLQRVPSCILRRCYTVQITSRTDLHSKRIVK